MGGEGAAAVGHSGRESLRELAPKRVQGMHGSSGWGEAPLGQRTHLPLTCRPRSRASRWRTVTWAGMSAHIGRLRAAVGHDLLLHPSRPLRARCRISACTAGVHSLWPAPPFTHPDRPADVAPVQTLLHPGTLPTPENGIHSSLRGTR
jgi:hypothetical protein